VTRSSSTRRHVVRQSMFGMLSKIDVPSAAMSRRSNRLVGLLLESERKLEILQQPRTTLTYVVYSWATLTI